MENCFWNAESGIEMRIYYGFDWMSNSLICSLIVVVVATVMTLQCLDITFAVEAFLGTDHLESTHPCGPIEDEVVLVQGVGDKRNWGDLFDDLGETTAEVGMETVDVACEGEAEGDQEGGVAASA